MDPNPVRLVSFQEEVLEEVPQWQGTGLVCWRLYILSQYRKRGKDEDRVTHELDGKKSQEWQPLASGGVYGQERSHAHFAFI